MNQIWQYIIVGIVLCLCLVYIIARIRRKVERNSCDKPEASCDSCDAECPLKDRK